MNAVFGRADGAILDLPRYRAAVDDGAIRVATPADFIPLPRDALLLTLPGRTPIAFADARRAEISELEGSQIDAVAAALPPGYTRTLLPAYAERPGCRPLPLYGYAAVAWHEGGLRVAARATDELPDWSPQTHSSSAVRAGIDRLSSEFAGNSLIRQLAVCANEYGCYTAQNVFLRQGEAAIPVSLACNAQCIGCISKQIPDEGVQAAQERVTRQPSVEEIVAVALAHLREVRKAIISFGQGCEGEPLLAAPRIEAAIRAIRKSTNAGTLHCNTNASRPKALVRLLQAGLQSIRVSLNSVRPEAYAAYYRPQGYDFSDVRESLRLAAERGAAISLNLLTHPGVTDVPEEVEAFREFLCDYPIAMVQTRTLNVDPARYFAAVGRPKRQPLWMARWLTWLSREFPGVRVGNFTRGFG